MLLKLLLITLVFSQLPNLHDHILRPMASFNENYEAMTYD